MHGQVRKVSKINKAKKNQWRQRTYTVQRRLKTFLAKLGIGLKKTTNHNMVLLGGSLFTADAEL